MKKKTKELLLKIGYGFVIVFGLITMGLIIYNLII